MRKKKTAIQQDYSKAIAPLVNGFSLPVIGTLEPTQTVTPSQPLSPSDPSSGPNILDIFNNPTADTLQQSFDQSHDFSDTTDVPLPTDTTSITQTVTGGNVQQQVDSGTATTTTAPAQDGTLQQSAQTVQEVNQIKNPVQFDLSSFLSGKWWLWYVVAIIIIILIVKNSKKK